MTFAPRIRARMRPLISIARIAGFDPVRTVSFLRGPPGFAREYRAFRSLQMEAGGDFNTRLVPVIGEKNGEAGSAAGHYFHQDLHVARRIHDLRPRRHIDVGSRIDGFVAHVAAFRPIEVLDIRPLRLTIPNVTFRQADLMEAPEDLLGSTDSLSSLHAVEHFGLGRYGDPLDLHGHVRAIRSLSLMLEPDGLLHLSFPIGPSRVEFNAQRVLSLRDALDLLQPLFRVERFSFVGDDGALVENVALDPALVDGNAGCHFGCGIFELRRKQANH